MDRNTHRGRRLRALLAAGLVLGVGATVTLAAWTDSENAQGTFSASVFALEFQDAGGAWQAASGAPVATLTFAGAEGLSPGRSTFAALPLRTSAASTEGGSLVLTEVTEASGALAPALEYRAVLQSASATCDAGAFGSIGYQATVVGPVASPPAPVALAPAGADPVALCVEVRIITGADSSFQGQTATVTWQVLATSTD